MERRRRFGPPPIAAVDRRDEQPARPDAGGFVAKRPARPLADQRLESDHDPLTRLEARLEASERLRQRQEAVFEQRLADLEARLSRGPDSGENAAGSAALSRENAFLKQLMAEMKTHVASLEELIISRDDKLKAVEGRLALTQSEVAKAQRTQDDVAQLRQLVLQAKPAQEAAALRDEVFRARQAADSARASVDELGAALSGRVASLEARAGSTEERLDAMAKVSVQERQTKGAWIESLAKQLQEQQHAVKATQDRIAQATAENARERQALGGAIGDLRGAIVRAETKAEERLAQHLEEVSHRLAQSESAVRAQTEAGMADTKDKIEHMHEALSLERRNVDLRVHKLTEEVLAKQAASDFQALEIRNEVAAQLDALQADQHREESARVDAVRRVHEDLLDQLDALKRSPSRGGGGGGAIADADKLEELEEVVRAEVRSRMRHAAKAREHVENTAKALMAANDRVRRELTKGLAEVNKRLTVAVGALDKRQQRDTERIESKLVEEAQDRHVADMEARERISECEAQIAKGAAMHRMDMDRTGARIEEARQEAESGIAAARETLREAIRSARDDQQAALDAAAGQLQASVNDVSERLEQHQADSALARVQVASELREEVAEVQAGVDTAVEGLTAGLEECRAYIQQVEAQKASEACMEAILAGLEEAERQEELKRQADERDARLRLEFASQISVVRDEGNASADRANAAVKALSSALGKTSAKWQEQRKALQDDLTGEVHAREAAVANAFKALEAAEHKVTVQFEEMAVAVRKVFDEEQVRSVVAELSAKVAEGHSFSQRDSDIARLDQATSDAHAQLASLAQELARGAQATSSLEARVAGLVDAAERDRLEQERMWEESVAESHRYFEEEPAQPAFMTTAQEQQFQQQQQLFMFQQFLHQQQQQQQQQYQGQPGAEWDGAGSLYEGQLGDSGPAVFSDAVPQPSDLETRVEIEQLDSPETQVAADAAVEEGAPAREPEQHQQHADAEEAIGQDDLQNLDRAEEEAQPAAGQRPAELWGEEAGVVQSGEQADVQGYETTPADVFVAGQQEQEIKTPAGSPVAAAELLEVDEDEFAL